MGSAEIYDYFAIANGDVAPPPSARLLGWRPLGFDPETGMLSASFEAIEAFLNPAGMVQGGILAAMLDDTLGPVASAVAGGALFAQTLEMKVSYLRPGRVGTIFAERGRDARSCFSKVAFMVPTARPSRRPPPLQRPCVPARCVVPEREGAVPAVSETGGSGWFKALRPRSSRTRSRTRSRRARTDRGNHERRGSTPSAALAADLLNEETGTQAAWAFRLLVDRIELLPDSDNLQIMLRGDHAVCGGQENPDVVAEARFGATCFRSGRRLRRGAIPDRCEMALKCKKATHLGRLLLLE